MSDLRVTDGAIEELPDGRLTVESPEMRAVLRQQTSQKVEARFTYLGPTVPQNKLADGEVRSQFGLKLRAQDGCNVIYVMWWIAPASGIQSQSSRTHRRERIVATVDM